MSVPATFRDLHPVARGLAGRLFEALQRSAEELLAKDTAAMTLVEHGRWTAQVLRLLKWLDKEFPEADEATKEGRAALHRLRGPEADAETKAAFDAIFGIYREPPPGADAELDEPPPKPDSPPAADEPPTAAGVNNPPPAAGEGGELASRAGGPALGPGRSGERTRHPVSAAQSSAPQRPSAFHDVDHDAEVAEIVRHVRAGPATR